MREKKENKKSPHSSLHQAVLQVNAGTERRWTAVLWSEPVNQEVFLTKLKDLINSTLVQEWIQPPRGGESIPPEFRSFDLLSFVAVPDDEALQSSLFEMGFEAIDFDSFDEEIWERLTVFQNEARRDEIEVPQRPVQGFRLPVHRNQGELADRIIRVCRRAERELSGEVWGEKPGLFSKVFCDVLRGEIQVRIQPDPTGLTILEDLLVDGAEGITWVEPLVFQVLTDFLGVLLQSQGDLEVQWSLCTVEESTGLAPPPLFRVRRQQGSWKIISIGSKVVDGIALSWSRPEKRPLLRYYEDVLSGLRTSSQ